MLDPALKYINEEDDQSLDKGFMAISVRKAGNTRILNQFALPCPSLAKSRP
mgnify:CR=1 FL=1